MPQQFINATISDTEQDDSLCILDGTMGPQAIDIQKLYSKYDMLAYDPGFRSTASCKSAITYVDGDNGILLYRGYPIEQLAEHATYLEVAYLLMFGELPTANQFSAFEDDVHHYSMLHDQVLSSFRGFVVMLIRWQLWSAWSAPCQRFIMTTWISMTRISGCRQPSAW